MFRSMSLYKKLALAQDFNKFNKIAKNFNSIIF